MFNKYFTIPLIRNIYVRIVFLYLDFEPNDFNNYLYNTIFLLATIFIRNYMFGTDIRAQNFAWGRKFALNFKLRSSFSPFLISYMNQIRKWNSRTSIFLIRSFNATCINQMLTFDWSTNPSIKKSKILTASASSHHINLSLFFLLIYQAPTDSLNERWLKWSFLPLEFPIKDIKVTVIHKYSLPKWQLFKIEIRNPSVLLNVP